MHYVQAAILARSVKVAVRCDVHKLHRQRSGLGQKVCTVISRAMLLGFAMPLDKYG